MSVTAAPGVSAPDVQFADTQAASSLSPQALAAAIVPETLGMRADVAAVAAASAPKPTQPVAAPDENHFARLPASITSQPQAEVGQIVGRTVTKILDAIPSELALPNAAGQPQFNAAAYNERMKLALGALGLKGHAEYGIGMEGLPDHMARYTLTATWDNPEVHAEDVHHVMNAVLNGTTNKHVDHWLTKGLTAQPSKTHRTSEVAAPEAVASAAPQAALSEAAAIAATVPEPEAHAITASQVAEAVPAVPEAAAIGSAAQPAIAAQTGVPIAYPAAQGTWTNQALQAAQQRVQPANLEKK